MKRNIVLIGFMGSGKSTLARILKDLLKWPYVSTDDHIEQKEGRKIAQIFKDSGEDYFRSLEQKVVEEIASREGIIVDCGGGVVLNPENVKLLKKTGTLVYLSCDPKVIYERILMQPKRPLLDVPDPLAEIQRLLKMRIPSYEQADITLNTSDGDMPRVASELMVKLNG
jgi:shikimate kinase